MCLAYNEPRNSILICHYYFRLIFCNSIMFTYMIRQMKTEFHQTTMMWIKKNSIWIDFQCFCACEHGFSPPTHYFFFTCLNEFLINLWREKREKKTRFYFHEWVWWNSDVMDWYWSFSFFPFEIGSNFFLFFAFFNVTFSINKIHFYLIFQPFRLNTNQNKIIHSTTTKTT